MSVSHPFYPGAAYPLVGFCMVHIIFALDACDYFRPPNRCWDAPCPYGESVCCQYCRRMPRCDAL